MRLNLSDLTIKNLKPPPSGQRTYLDPTLPGFGVRVSQGGTKTFTLMHGQQRRLKTIGRYPILSLSQARQRARELMAEQILGLVQIIPTMKFEEAFDLFKQTHTRQKNKKRTADETERLIQKHLIPKLGRDKIGDISTHQVMQIVDKLLDTPGTAIHVFWAARMMFRWAEKRRLISRSPLDGIDPPCTIKSRDRVLTDDELKKVWIAAGQLGTFGTIVRLLILTGQRRSEIASLQTSWITQSTDRQLGVPASPTTAASNASVWTITFPKEITKNGREHCFPLSSLASGMLSTLPMPSSLVFPARGQKTKPFSGWSKCKKTLDKASGVTGYCLHDLRRTYCSGLQRLGVALTTIEKLVNHVSGSFAGVVGIYQRYDFLPEMRAAQEKWESHVELLTSTPSEVG